jgi:hypothetical protein
LVNFLRMLKAGTQATPRSLMLAGKYGSGGGGRCCDQIRLTEGARRCAHNYPRSDIHGVHAIARGWRP